MSPRSERLADRIILRCGYGCLLVAVLIALLTTETRTANAAPAPAPELRVASALFTPARTEAGVDWRSHWVLTPESAASLATGTKGMLRFAGPLRDDATLEQTTGVVPVVEGGHVVGAVVDASALDGRTLSAVVHQRITLHGGGSMQLGAPIAAGTALQIVDGDLGAGTRLEVDTGGVFERRVGHVAAPGISHAQREEARRLTGYDSRVTGAPLYVRGEDLRSGEGLTATVVTPSVRNRHGNLAIGVLFGAIVLALLGAVRRLRHAASVERADALLAAEVDALEQPRGAAR